MADESVAIEIRGVEGFPGYGVSADGRVWSRWLLGQRIIGPDWREMSVSRNKQRQRRVGFWREGQQSFHFVCRLVLAAFIGPCPHGMQCLHGPLGRDSDALDNIKWGTPKENAADRWRDGTMRAGERCNLSVVTEADVREIRILRSQGVVLADIAKRFGIGKAAVSHIATGRNWSHVK